MNTLSEKEITHILQKYPVGKLKTTRILCGGVENLNIAITTTTGNYVLRLHRESHSFRTKNYITFELDLIDFLRTKKFPVPKVVRMKNGERLFDFKDTHGVLFSFEPGKHILTHDLWQIKEVGRILGKLHTLTHDLKLKHAVARKIISTEKIQNYITQNIKQLHESSIAQELLRLTQSPRLTLPKELPTGCIHVDLHDENALFKGRKISAVLDWDDSFHGPAIFDLGLALRHWCSKTDEIDYKKARILVQAYEKERTLTTQEKKALQCSCFIVTLWHTSYLLQPQHISKQGILNCIKDSTLFLTHLDQINEKEFYDNLF